MIRSEITQHTFLGEAPCLKEIYPFSSGTATVQSSNCKSGTREKSRSQPRDQNCIIGNDN